MDQKNLPEGYIRVLDEHAFVGLVDSMGNDMDIVHAARISIAGENVKVTSNERGLIRYLLRKRHTTPFEMVQFKFHAKMPIFVARQWVRHRMASINEMSARYSELPKEFYLPPPEQIKKQAEKNKQGRSDEGFSPEEIELILSIIETQSSNACIAYQQLLDMGVARELARIVLPLNIYTEWYWKTDLHNLMHFLSLRMDPHAQWEIRVFADAMAEMVKHIVPIAFEAFEDYRLNGMFLSSDEVRALSEPVIRMIESTGGDPSCVTLDDGEHGFKTKREKTEFGEKVNFLWDMRR